STIDANAIQLGVGLTHSYQSQGFVFSFLYHALGSMRATTPDGQVHADSSLGKENASGLIWINSNAPGTWRFEYDWTFFTGRYPVLWILEIGSRS
ncbi:MAG: hypothetical protein ACRDJM_06670, partial [Actinomycetota bacterium]